MRVQLLEEGAVTPTKATEFSAGFDLYSVEEKMLLPNSTSVIRTGIAVEIPFGCVGILKGRSSLSLKGIHVLAGVIDADFRGEISVVMSIDNEAYKIVKTERIAQLLIIPLAPIGNHLEVVEELSETERGEKGFGSSNNTIAFRQPYPKKDFGTTHMSMGGITTICGEDTTKVAYYTSNPNDVTCEICKKGSRVKYSKDICGNE